MLKPVLFLAACSLAARAATSAPDPLSGSEVRIPYAELVRLLDAAAPKPARHDPPPAPDPALASCTIRLRFDGGTPSLSAAFHISNPGLQANVPVPLLPASVRILALRPANAALQVRDQILYLATAAGDRTEAEMELDFADGTIAFPSPPCPCPVMEVPDLPADTALKLTAGDRTLTVTKAARIGLPASGTALSLQIISHTPVKEAAPPGPSLWSWQQEAVVAPADGMLDYHITSHASASGGGGTEAKLQLPSDARRVEVSGEDLSSHDILRDTAGNQFLVLRWTTAAVLDRTLHVGYRTPLRPLDREWNLEAPCGTDPGPTKTRFLIPENPRLEFSADGLSAALDAGSLSGTAAREAGNAALRILEADHTAKLGVRELPVVATPDATITSAIWKSRVEPDGASFTEGTLTILHQRAQRVLVTLPEGANLVACTVDEKPVDPILHNSALGIPLDARNDSRPASLRLSYTLRVEKPDPLRGSLPMSLPATPLLVKELSWDLTLPAAYQAEVSGNLERADNTPDNPQTVHLRKNLCRDERPTVQVFYSRK